MNKPNLAAGLCLSLALTACGNETNRMPDAATAAPAPSNATAAADSLTYPATRREAVTDSYFDTEVADPYRWLEDDLSEETGDWVQAQNQVTQGYLAQIPYREKIASMYRELLDYEREGAPFFEGAYRYFYRNDGLQNQSVLYRQAEGGEPEIFLDPNGFSEDGTVSMSEVSFSRDGSLVAYQLSEGGSDWRTIVVREVETGEVVGEPLQNVKFSDIAWLGNEGIYYSSYDEPDGSRLTSKTDRHKVYFHRIGTSQSEDELIFGGPGDQKHRYVEAGVTEDDRFLWIDAANTGSGNRLFLKDLTVEDGELFALLADDDAEAWIVDSEGDFLYIETNKEAPNRRLVRVNAAEPAYERWEEVIPEREQVLSVSTGAGFFFANYMVDVMSHVEQFDRDGNLIREIDLPDLGTAAGFSGKQDQETLYFTFTNHRFPTSIFSLDTVTGQTSLYRASASSFDTDAYVTKQVFYESLDGTRVPMTITHAADLELDGNNPTLLYGYGGFNVSERPSFRTSVALWLELGGVYAAPNIRGGGEYGESWHQAGTLEQKQNVFDDFIAAAEYLKDNGYTRKERLALYGGSNGGLLVGAVMTQRPDLFQVALPAVGVLDMLRYHTFTSGAGWAYDYGTSEDSESMFQYLLGYSPLHNLKDGVSYPATLVTTADHDDRVVPAHSFKFAAELQQSHEGAAPVLIRVETDAGHGGGMPISKIIDLYADQYGFALYNMGVEGL